jgi:hypothetical protein
MSIGKKHMIIKISATTPLLPGTISTAMAKCGQKTCKCQTNPKHLHGPYYRWTGLIDGKQTTITLTKDEAKECSRRIKNWKKLQEKITKLKENALNAAPWNTRKTS